MLTCSNLRAHKQSNKIFLIVIAFVFGCNQSQESKQKREGVFAGDTILETKHWPDTVYYDEGKPHYITIDGSVEFDIVPSNSCQPYFDINKISVHYSYSTPNQTHDYSNNWDFDADGKTDELYFIGTGGAHLYFYLRIVLSSDKKVRDFPFLNIDIPCLGNIAELKNAKFYPPPSFPQFVVDKFPTGGLGDNANDKIYLHLDNYSILPKVWKKRGVTSRYLLLQYDKGDITIKNFIE